MLINLHYNKFLFLLVIYFMSCFLFASQKKTVKTINIIGAETVKESLRSEERRGGKECRSRWSPDH